MPLWAVTGRPSRCRRTPSGTSRSARGLRTPSDAPGARTLPAEDAAGDVDGVRGRRRACRIRRAVREGRGRRRAAGARDGPTGSKSRRQRGGQDHGGRRPSAATCRALRSARRTGRAGDRPCPAGQRATGRAAWRRVRRCVRRAGGSTEPGDGRRPKRPVRRRRERHRPGLGGRRPADGGPGAAPPASRSSSSTACLAQPLRPAGPAASRPAPAETAVPPGASRRRCRRGVGRAAGSLARQAATSSRNSPVEPVEFAAPRAPPCRAATAELSPGRGRGRSPRTPAPRPARRRRRQAAIALCRGSARATCSRASRSRRRWRSATAVPSVARAMPKSISRGPSRVSSTLDGLTSRCTRPSPCTAAAPRRARRPATRTACSRQRAVRRRRPAYSEGPADVAGGHPRHRAPRGRRPARARSTAPPTRRAGVDLAPEAGAELLVERRSAGARPSPRPCGRPRCGPDRPGPCRRRRAGRAAGTGPIDARVVRSQRLHPRASPVDGRSSLRRGQRWSAPASTAGVPPIVAVRAAGRARRRGRGLVRSARGVTPAASSSSTPPARRSRPGGRTRRRRRAARAEAEVERGEVALQDRRVEGLPAGGLLGDLGDLLQGQVPGGEEGPVHLADDRRARAPGSRGGRPRPRRRTAARSTPSTSARGRGPRGRAAGASCRLARSAASPISTAASASCIIRLEVGRAGVVVGLRPRTARRAAAGPAVRRCARWSRGRPGRRPAGPAAPARRSRRTSPGRRSRPRCRGSATSSSALLRNSTRVIGPMSRSPCDQLLAELLRGVLGQLEVEQRAGSGEPPVEGQAVQELDVADAGPDRGRRSARMRAAQIVHIGG